MSGFESPQGRAKLAMGGIVLVMAIGVAAIVSSTMQLALLEELRGGAALSESVAAANDSREAMIGILSIVAYLISGVLFLRWFHQSYKNLAALGSYMTHTPGWAIGAWFVPFLNLIRPYQMVVETWAGSEPSQATVKTSPLIGFWWFAWILGNVLGYVELRLAIHADSFDSVAHATQLAIMGSVIELLAGVLILLVISGLTRRQIERAKARGV